MDFSNGEYLYIIESNVNIPNRVISKKGWIFLDELCNSYGKEKNIDIKSIKKKVNIKFNSLTYNCKYISK